MVESPSIGVAPSGGGSGGPALTGPGAPTLDALGALRPVDEFDRLLVERRATLFFGNGEYSVDEKGRLTLPAHMRPPLSRGGVVKAVENRALLWPRAVFDHVVAELNARIGHFTKGDPDHQLEQRQVKMFITSVMPCSLDGQGRIVVPPKVRTDLNLGRDVFIAGCGAHIELWAAGQYEVSMLLAQDDKVADFLDELNL